MNNAPATLRAVFLGCTTIILVGYALSFLALPLESLVVEHLYPEPATVAELVELMFWPSIIAIGAGILITFILGGFVTARLSVTRPTLIALIPALLFVILTWAPIFIRSVTAYTMPTVFSLSGIIGAWVGGVIGARASATKVS